MFKKNRVVAGLSSLWVGCVFFASGFAEAEEVVSTGVAGDAVQQSFVAWNVPLDASFAAFYTACFLLLLLFGRRVKHGQQATGQA